MEEPAVEVIAAMSVRSRMTAPPASAAAAVKMAVFLRMKRRIGAQVDGRNGTVPRDGDSLSK
jgi:hypothetical protein